MYAKDDKSKAKKSALQNLMSHSKSLNIGRSDKLSPKSDGDLTAQTVQTEPKHVELVSDKEASNLGEYGDLNGLVGVGPKQESDLSLPENDPVKQALPPEEVAPSEDMHKNRLRAHMMSKRGK